MGRAGQRQCHAPSGCHLAESGMAFPLGKVVGIVGILGLGAHTLVGEVPVVLGVVPCGGMVVEVVFELLEQVIVIPEIIDAVHACQHIVVVVVLPRDAHVEVEVEGIEREQGGIGLLIDELQIVGAVLPHVQVDVLMPNLIGQADFAVRHGYHVPSQAAHGALAQPEGEVEGLVQFGAEVVGGANLGGYQFLAVIAQTHASLDGVLGIGLAHEFVGLVIVDVAQMDDAVVGLVIGRHTSLFLQYHDGVQLGSCRLLAALNQLLDGRAVEVGR